MMSLAGLNYPAGVRGLVLPRHAHRATSVPPRAVRACAASSTTNRATLPRCPQGKLFASTVVTQGVTKSARAIERAPTPSVSALKAPSGFFEDDEASPIDRLLVFISLFRMIHGTNNILPGAPSDVAVVETTDDARVPQDRRPLYLREITSKPSHMLVPADGMTWYA